MPKTRQQLKDEFAAEVYLHASFFKMKTTGCAAIDTKANGIALEVGIRTTGIPLVEFPNADITKRFIPEKEKFPKLKITRSGKK